MNKLSGCFWLRLIFTTIISFFLWTGCPGCCGGKDQNDNKQNVNNLKKGAANNNINENNNENNNDNKEDELLNAEDIDKIINALWEKKWKEIKDQYTWALFKINIKPMDKKYVPDENLTEIKDFVGEKDRDDNAILLTKAQVKDLITDKDDNKTFYIFFKNMKPKGGYSLFKNLQNNSKDEDNTIFMYSIDILNANTARVRDMSFMFSECKNLTGIKGLEKIRKNRVQNMNYMFKDCASLKTLNLSGLDTIDVTDMSFMFYGCSSLTEIDLSTWENTGKVIDMSHMFKGCTNLKRIKWPDNLNTENVENISYMFYGCSSLTEIDLSTWKNTGNVKNMSGMFEECSSLTKLPDNISNWNTSNVTDMSNMFKGCSLLKRLPNLSNWNTGSVEYMECMFEECVSLQTLEISNWDTKNVKNMNYMFSGCKALQNLTLPNKINERATKEGMFNGCGLLDDSIKNKFLKK